MAERREREDNQNKINPVVERGSDRFWRRLNIVSGTLLVSGLAGNLLGYAIESALGVSPELSFKYRLLATGLGMFIGLYTLTELKRARKIKL